MLFVLMYAAVFVALSFHLDIAIANRATILFVGVLLWATYEGIGGCRSFLRQTIAGTLAIVGGILIFLISIRLLAPLVYLFHPGQLLEFLIGYLVAGIAYGAMFFSSKWIGKNAIQWSELKPVDRD